ncbi:protein required for attachment to host cells [Rhodovulum bhavnagarense]|uniref:Protein required for attachment to host cells n=1 Tax=Rhodovulum bhavnagarense TaxID=992286 RepID=A0A4R2RJ91_9RHOB|nr:host attachment protein [Rhodovulum bhavnagarense]TCP62934.1 protein required for attachment to host cells [Rhodovulum bhavnagarense]
MKPVRTLILIASEHQARLLSNDGPGLGVNEVAAFDKPGQARYADTPGRGQAAPGTARHGFDRSSSEREQNREAFATDVLDIAGREWGRGGYDRFVLSAPPEMLGALRARLDGPLRDALAGDLNKDLLGVEIADLPRHFEDVIVF